jgi:hypothetical protein
MPFVNIVLTSAVVDPDPDLHWSALIWLTWIRIRIWNADPIKEHGS